MCRDAPDHRRGHSSEQHAPTRHRTQGTRSAGGHMRLSLSHRISIWRVAWPWGRNTSLFVHSTSQLGFFRVLSQFGLSGPPLTSQQTVTRPVRRTAVPGTRVRVSTDSSPSAYCDHMRVHANALPAVPPAIISRPEILSGSLRLRRRQAGLVPLELGAQVRCSRSEVLIHPPIELVDCEADVLAIKLLEGVAPLLVGSA